MMKCFDVCLPKGHKLGQSRGAQCSHSIGPGNSGFRLCRKDGQEPSDAFVWGYNLIFQAIHIVGTKLGLFFISIFFNKRLLIK